MDDRDDMMKRAEREVVDAAMVWAERRARNIGQMSDVEQRLYNAAIMLRSTRRATGSFHLEKK